MDLCYGENLTAQQWKAADSWRETRGRDLVHIVSTNAGEDMMRVASSSNRGKSPKPSYFMLYPT